MVCFLTSDKRQVIDKQQASSTTYLCFPHKGVGVGERGKCVGEQEGEKGAANAVHKLVGESRAD